MSGSTPFPAGQIVGARMRPVHDGIEIELFAQAAQGEAPTPVRVFLFPDRATEFASNLLAEVEEWKKKYQN